MLPCPNCGYKNADEAETCLRCGSWLLEPDEPEPADEFAEAAPIPLPQAASMTRRQKVLAFLLGAVLGLVPAIIFAIGTINSWGTIGCYLFLLILLIMGILLSQKETRAFGNGLLAAALISPIIVAISCSVNPSHQPI